MVLARGTAATVPRLQPECQQLSLLHPVTPQPLHLCPALAFPRQAQHSRDGLGILEMPPVEVRAGSSCLMPRETRGPLNPGFRSWKTQGPTYTPRNDDTSEEEAGLLWVPPPARIPFQGLVTCIFCVQHWLNAEILSPSP